MNAWTLRRPKQSTLKASCHVTTSPAGTEASLCTGGIFIAGTIGPPNANLQRTLPPHHKCQHIITIERPVGSYLRLISLMGLCHYLTSHHAFLMCLHCVKNWHSHRHSVMKLAFLQQFWLRTLHSEAEHHRRHARAGLMSKRLTGGTQEAGSHSLWYMKMQPATHLMPAFLISTVRRLRAWNCSVSSEVVASRERVTLSCSGSPAAVSSRHAGSPGTLVARRNTCTPTTHFPSPDQTTVLVSAMKGTYPSSMTAAKKSAYERRADTAQLATCR